MLLVKNRSVGYFVVSKKSGLLRWLVSGGICVQSEPVWISTDADFSVFVAVSTSAVPLNSAKPPTRGSGFAPVWVPTKPMLELDGRKMALPSAIGTGVSSAAAAVGAAATLGGPPRSAERAGLGAAAFAGDSLGARSEPAEHPERIPMVELRKTAGSRRITVVSSWLR